MADTVEIQNVGGLRGVASEATLLELRDAIVAQNRGGSSGANSRLSSSLQDAYNRSLAGSNNEQSRFTKLLYTAGRGLKELAFGGNRASDFSDAIFGAGSSISILTSYLDDNIDTWRELSSVGASFNNSIFDMIGSAANSGMELDQYSAFIRKNSEIMKVFGGTTTLGAKRVGELSKNLRSSELGGRLFEMGFTINDINEGLVNYVDLQVRLGRSETLNTKNLTQATAEYMTDLDALAKVTGKTREEFASFAKQIAVDGRIRALAARASQDGADNLTKNLAATTAMLPGLGETILNISSGFIGNDNMAKALEVSLGPAGREFSNLIKNAGNITQDEFVDKMAKVGPALSDYLKSMDPTTLAFLKTQDGVAGALSSLADMGYQFDQMGMANSAAAKEEQARTSKITGTLSKFEQAVIDLRKKFVDFFYDLTMQEGGLFDALSGLGDVVKELTSPSTNGLAGIGTSLLNYTKDGIGLLFGKNGYVTEGITILTTWLKGVDFEAFVEDLEEAIASVTTWFSELGDDISNKGFWNTFKERIFDLGNWIKELFLGSTVTEMTPDGPKEVRNQGLFENMATGFSNLFNNTEIITSMTSGFQKLFDTVINGFVNFWESDSAKGIKDIVVNMFNEIYIRVLEVLDQIPFVDMSGQLRSMSHSSQDKLRAGEKISAKEAENIREQLANDIASMEDSMDGLNWFLNSQEEIDQKTQSIEFLKQRQTEIDAMLAALGQAEVNSNAQGTNGFQDFGKKSYATMHGIEAVVPRNTAAGDLLQSFYDFQNKKVATVTSTPMASDSQSSLIKKVEELNTTMIKVAELLQSSVGLQAKTVKGVKGLGSDYYRGINR